MTRKPGLMTGMSMGLAFQVMNAFAEEKECEHPSHATDPIFHAGKAAWYVQIVCPKCGSKTDGVKAVCDKWVQGALSSGRLKCASGTHPCGEISTDWKFTVLERI